MDIDVILENGGGELDRARLNIAEGEDFDDRVDYEVANVIEGWMLSVGDTIRIVEID